MGVIEQVRGIGAYGAILANELKGEIADLDRQFECLHDCGLDAVNWELYVLGAGGVVRSLAARTTYLYQKVGPAGEHLKFGITANPATRYTAAELNGGRLRIIAQGERSEMLRLERQLHETLPLGPEERQLFYIQKQIENGLRPPPY